MAVYIKLVSTTTPDPIEDKFASIISTMKAPRGKGGKIIVRRQFRKPPKSTTHSFAMRVAKLDDMRIRVRLWRSHDMSLVTDQISYMVNGSLMKAAWSLVASLGASIPRDAVLKHYCRKEDRIEAGIINSEGVRKPPFYISRDALEEANVELSNHYPIRRVRIFHNRRVKGHENLDVVLISYNEHIYVVHRTGNGRNTWWQDAYYDITRDSESDGAYSISVKYEVSPDSVKALSDSLIKAVKHLRKLK